ncbi:MAG: alpha/beta fold hydrolase [Croceibacterium sp.]
MSFVFKVFVRLIGVALLIGAPCAVSAAEPPPLSAYGNLPDVEMMALSNSGERLAAVMKIGGERVVLLMTSELDPLRMMKLEDAKVRSMEWIGDDHVVVRVSKTETLGPDFVQSQFEFFYALVLPANNTDHQDMIFGDDPTMLNATFGSYGVRQVNGRWMTYFGGVKRQRGARGYYLGNAGTSLFAVDIAKNKWTEVGSPGSQGFGYDWLLGPDGTVAAMLTIDRRTGSWNLKVPDGPVLAHGENKLGNVGLVTLGRDARTVLYSERNEDEGLTRWFEVPLDGLAPPVEYIKAEEVERRFTDRNTGQLLGLLHTGENQRPQFFDPAQQRVIDNVYRAFSGSDIDLMDWTPDFARVLVRTTGNGDSGTWFLVDMASLHASAVGYERDAITAQAVGPISRVAYKASDGLDLDGILTLPPGRDPRDLPVVLLPHGGPHAQDVAAFDWWAQAFASRGYAVFQPNFRGSTNRDEAFLRAGFGQWGRAMQTDISDGLAELARLGIVDPKRACIVGASYGGYAALAGVTLQQGIYRCAVAVAPVADLSSLFSSELNNSGLSSMLRRSLVEELGPRSGFDAVSPRRFADRADAPILLIHGRDDTVVPFSQSDGMADALKAAGKPYRLVDLGSEDHWLSTAAARERMLTEAVAYVEQYNPAE